MVIRSRGLVPDWKGGAAGWRKMIQNRSCENGGERASLELRNGCRRADLGPAVAAKLAMP
jgi:hypothetical protein